MYRADATTNDIDELYSVPITGGSPLGLNDPLVGGGDVIGLTLSPDGAVAIYYADQRINDVFELYSISVVGGMVQKLTGTFPSGGDVWPGFTVTPDSEHVVFLADQLIEAARAITACDDNVAAVS